MPTNTSSVFKISLLAAAIITTTGCASTSPNQAGGGIGDSLKRAGSATAQAGSTIWKRTGFILGLHDDPGIPVQSADNTAITNQPSLDEVDLAMMEEDAVLPSTGLADSIEVRSTQIENAIAEPQGQLDQQLATTESELNLFSPEDQNRQADALANEALANVTLANDALASVAPASEAESLDNLAVVALDDYTHEVGENETLWDIAKLTTGDATNWHTLADINNLAPNASVFPGQSLTIPADMLRPELAGGPIADEQPLVTEEQTLIAQAETRLAIPEAPTASEEPLRVATSAESPVAPAALTSSSDARGFDVEAGETLWDFAKRTTGDATFWQAIAAHNGFTEAQSVAVREGQEIFVPEVLIRPELAGSDTAIAAAQPLVEEASALVDNELNNTDAEALDAGASVLAAATAPAAEAGILDETQDITIVEAAFREDTAIDTGADAAEPNGQSVGEIMISGTYYPKAIYNDADFSSSLLTRVSPGTTLAVTQVDGAWYKVETEQGVGYVHNRDIK